MKKVNLLLMLLMTAITMATAQKGTRTFNLKNFNKLSIGSAFKINVTQGNSFRIVASGEQRDLDDLEAKTMGGTLSVKYKEKRSNRKSVTLDIQMPALSGIDLSGAASMKATGFQGGGHLDLDVSGAASLVLDITSDVVDFDLSGASSTTLSGSAGSLRGDLSGASSLKAGDFQVKEAEIEASGASSALVRTSSSLRAKASGASSIRYRGSAKDIRVNTSGGSSVKKSG